MASIQNSVGKNQNNGVSDVLVVQAVFNKFLMAGCVPGVAPLTLDGRCGGKTGNTIISFQRGIVGTRLLDHAELWNAHRLRWPIKVGGIGTTGHPAHYRQSVCTLGKGLAQMPTWRNAAR